MIRYRVLLTILILAFTAGVTCAAVCGQQSGQKHEDGSRCDECVSTAFESGTKIVDAGFFPMPVGEPSDGESISGLFVQHLVILPQLPFDAPPSVIDTPGILRI
jgi:hypothetical protein